MRVYGIVAHGMDQVAWNPDGFSRYRFDQRKHLISAQPLVRMGVMRSLGNCCLADARVVTSSN